MNKLEIREQFKAKRNQLSDVEIELYSEEIANRFLKYLTEHPEIQHIHIFLPIKRLKEVNTFPLVEKLLDRNYKLYTSKVSEDGLLNTLTISNLENIIIDKWGIPLPKVQEETSPENIQLIVVPLLAFDKNGFRIGYGKGYYDKLITQLDTRVIKLGFSFFEAVENLPIEPHDKELNMCILPKKMCFFN